MSPKMVEDLKILSEVADNLVQSAIRRMTCPEDMRIERSFSLRIEECAAPRERIREAVVEQTVSFFERRSIKVVYNAKYRSVSLTFNLVSVSFNRIQAEAFCRRIEELKLPSQGVAVKHIDNAVIQHLDSGTHEDATPSIETFKAEVIQLPLPHVKPVSKRKRSLKERRLAAVAQELLQEIVPEDIVPDPRDDESCSSHLRGNVDV